MRKKLEYFGFSVTRVLQNLIPAKKVQKLGNFLLLRRSTRRPIKYVRLKIKMSHMSQDCMQMIYLQKESIQRQPPFSVRLQETLKRSF